MNFSSAARSAIGLEGAPRNRLTCRVDCARRTPVPDAPTIHRTSNHMAAFGRGLPARITHDMGRQQQIGTASGASIRSASFLDKVEQGARRRECSCLDSSSGRHLRQSHPDGAIGAVGQRAAVQTVRNAVSAWARRAFSRQCGVRGRVAAGGKHSTTPGRPRETPRRRPAGCLRAPRHMAPAAPPRRVLSKACRGKREMTLARWGCANAESAASSAAVKACPGCPMRIEHAQP